jgi:hypothetical protein
MAHKMFEPATLNDLAAMVEFSLKEADKTQVASLLTSVREGVMRRANLLAIESPPALFYDPR